MAEKNLGTVRDAAERVVEVNRPYYNKRLLKTIPKELLEMELTDNNLFLVSNLIDKFKFARCGYLAGILGYPLKEVFIVGGRLYKHWIDLTNSDLLPSRQQQQIIKEIKFLNNLVLTVAHQ